jgi:phosphoenolpyruvate carboxykinase (ATP)
VWKINRERAVDYLNTRNRIYVIDGYAGWDERYRISVRVVCARAYHALFMRNMLIRPTREQLKTFHPDYVIYNAGAFPANRYTTGMTSATSVSINFAEKEMVILGTEYAGEMKKGGESLLFVCCRRCTSRCSPAQCDPSQLDRLGLPNLSLILV